MANCLEIFTHAVSIRQQYLQFYRASNTTKASTSIIGRAFVAPRPRRRAGWPLLVIWSRTRALTNTNLNSPPPALPCLALPCLLYCLPRFIRRQTARRSTTENARQRLQRVQAGRQRTGREIEDDTSELNSVTKSPRRAKVVPTGTLLDISGPWPDWRSLTLSGRLSIS